MLGKLFKHEFRTTGRYIVTLLVLLIVVTPLTALYLKFSTSDVIDKFTINNFNIFKIFSVLSVLVYVAALVSAVTATTILLIYNIYKSMVTSQGYLTHTLPVPTSYIIISKGVVMFVWKVLSVIVAFISLMIFTYILGVWHFDDIAAFIKELMKLNLSDYMPSMILLAATLIFGTIQKILMYFASFAVGHRMNGHPFLGSVIAYIIGSFILSIISAIANTITNFAFIYTGSYGLTDTIDIMMIPAIIISIVSGVVFYIISVYMFKNKLNI